MCGIAGIVNAGLPLEELPQRLARMERSLIHRGPDEGRILIHGQSRSGLAARRLSIVDLEHGSQPVANEDGTIFALLNGEIYNHQILREKLLSLGHQFRGRSDTETLVHLYETYGVDCLDRLRGMFALAILDTGSGRLLLARDGPGMKPLYFANTRRGFVFASEANALFASGLIQPEPDPEAIDTCLAVGFVPAPRSAFRGVAKLEAGHYLTLAAGEMRQGAFWKYHYRGSASTQAAGSYADELDTLLTDSVRSHLAADVPVGAFLSGGWDSSLVATMAARAISHPLKTFSIVFPEDPNICESRFSRRMANFLSSEHHEIEFRTSDLPDLIPRLSRRLEEPCLNVPTALDFHLASLAGAHVKTVLSGEGSDELFGGYKRYRVNYPYLARRLFPRWPARVAGSWCPRSRLRRDLRVMGAPSDAAADAESVRLWTPEEKRRALRPELRVGGPDIDPTLIPPDVLATCEDRLQRRLGFEFHGRLGNGILFATDKLSMAHSLEVRMPFLDRSILEFALRLPSRHKVHRGREKVVLSTLASRYLPLEIASRRKQGLDYPPQCWRHPEFKKYVRELLLDCAGNSPFDPVFIRKQLPTLLQRPNSLLMRFVLLQSWWNEFFVAPLSIRGHAVIPLPESRAESGTAAAHPDTRLRQQS